MSTEIFTREVRDWRGEVPSHMTIVSPRLTHGMCRGREPGTKSCCLDVTLPGVCRGLKQGREKTV